MSSRHISELGFVLIALAGIVMQTRARGNRRRGLPRDRGVASLGEALSSAMTTTAGKVVVLGWWWWLGWHFLAR
jgi:hypothetical protein